jgi:uncharacterized protein (TIGR03437 family)
MLRHTRLSNLLLVLLAATSSHAQPAPPAITVNPASLTFVATAGQSSPTVIPVSVSSPVAGSTYTASSNQPWLTPTPISNATGGATTVHLSATAASLTAGVYTGTVSCTAPNFVDAATTVTFIVTNPSGTFAAASGSPFPAGAAPQSVAVGDFNGDGNPDLVTANAGGSVTVLLGDGTGAFLAAANSPFPVGANPASVAVADFNGDGNLDIVTANSGDNTVTVLLGDGTGNFTAAANSPFAVGTNPNSVAVADFNGDGHPDIVTANTGGNDVTVLLGNASGGFTPAPGSPFAVGLFPQSVAVGDFNGDGKPDLVTANAGNDTVRVLLGNGLGGFTGGGAFPAGSFPHSVAVMDLNGDGKPDIVAANSGSHSVTVLLGTGSSGGFTAAAGSPFAVGANPQSVAALDVNGDGKPDLVTANAGDNTVTVLLGNLSNASGGFTAAGGSPFAAGSTPVSLATADFNGDGRPDIAMANIAGGTLTVLLGTQAISNSVLTTTAASTITWGTAAPLKLVVTGGFSTPAGTATFLDGGVLIGIALQTASPFLLTATGLAAGVHMLTGAYAGDPATAPSSSNTIVLTVMPANQTIAFGALSSKIFGAVPFALNATATSGLAVDFTSTTPLVCTVSGMTVTVVGGGACAIQADQPGNTSYAAAPSVSRQFTVTPASQTITFGALTSQPAGTLPFAVSATASSGLAVSFTSTTSPVCTLSGATVTLVGVGACTIQAAQAGDTSYAAAVPVNQRFAVTPAAQTITFGALPDQILGTAPGPLIATASSGLTVTFVSTTTPVCSVLSTTVRLVIAGTCTIRASQAGNTSYAPAAPVSQSFNVNPEIQTIAFAAIPNTPFGTLPFTVNATASSGLAVTLTSVTPSICTVAASKVTIVSVGGCTIEASQAGNDVYAPAAPVEQTVTATQAGQTITFGVIANKAFGAAPFTIAATASSHLAVTFASNSNVCAVSGTTVSLAIGGTCTIQASQPGNVDYTAATAVPQSFTVTPASQTITFGAIANQTFGAAPLTLGATASSGLGVIFTSTTLAVCTISATTLTTIGAGACTIQATQPGNEDYAAAAPVARTFTVAPAVLAIRSILNAASYAAIPIASDSCTVAFGTGFSAAATVTVAGSNGLRLTAPLLYVSPTQINFLAPAGLANGGATVTVANPTGVKTSFATTVAQVSPALFTADSSGTGAPAAIALAYSAGAVVEVPVFSCMPVCTATPIDLGPPSTSVYLELYGTGIRGRTSLSGVSVMLGGVSLEVTYAGAQNTYPGLDQVNVLLDRSLIGAGVLTLQLTVDGVAANPVEVNIR